MLYMTTSMLYMTTSMLYMTTSMLYMTGRMLLLAMPIASDLILTHFVVSQDFSRSKIYACSTYCPQTYFQSLSSIFMTRSLSMFQILEQIGTAQSDVLSTNLSIFELFQSHTKC